VRLREYIVKGFTMDDERLKESGGGNYWKELLDRIRDIRSSESLGTSYRISVKRKIKNYYYSLFQ
jgi:hypothetical protein